MAATQNCQSDQNMSAHWLSSTLYNADNLQNKTKYIKIHQNTSKYTKNTSK
jgi:hypothetical protein